MFSFSKITKIFLMQSRVTELYYGVHTFVIFDCLDKWRLKLGQKMDEGIHQNSCKNPNNRNFVYKSTSAMKSNSIKISQLSILA